VLDKTQLSFFPPLGGVYIVRIGELFSCELAQMIFGLLKKTILLQWEVSRLVLEGFVFPSPPVYRKKKGVIFPNRPI
jgi:hypothetical protein